MMKRLTMTLGGRYAVAGRRAIAASVKELGYGG